jgi:hypothetical protein
MPGPVSEAAGPPVSVELDEVKVKAQPHTGRKEVWLFTAVVRLAGWCHLLVDCAQEGLARQLAALLCRLGGALLDGGEDGGDVVHRHGFRWPPPGLPGLGPGGVARCAPVPVGIQSKQRGSDRLRARHEIKVVKTRIRPYALGHGQ